MPESTTYRSYWERLFYFFPFQLVILHFKKNHLLLLFWLLLFGYITGNLATKYGVHYLFLYPEYLGRVSFWSYLIVGFSVGGFIMAFNIYTYIIHAYRFPFLASLAKPFYKFSVNNFIIPTLFVITYLWLTVKFQRGSEFESAGNILIHISGFLIGLLLFMWGSFYYFFKTNKDVFKFLDKKNLDEEDVPKGLRPRVSWGNKGAKVKEWRIETYLKNFTTVLLARDVDHYEEETMKRVFFQNHINASIFELILVGGFLLVSTFDQFQIFVLPAGASVILVFTLFLMLISVFLSWFRGWTLTLLVVLLLVANHFSTDFAILPAHNEIFGLNYDTEATPYEGAALKVRADDPELKNDLYETVQILEKWKANNSIGKEHGYKPKLLLVNASGGGLRSALWTCTSLCELDSALDGRLMDKCMMITGASGGMLGTAYLRQMSFQNEGPIYTQKEEIKQNIGKDLLNPVLFSIASSDLFFRHRFFEYNEREYTVDRAFKFEQQYIANTGGIMDHDLQYYAQAEREAQIPMMILSPTIVNDGRRLMISPQPISYLCLSDAGNGITHQAETEDVEYCRLFATHDPLESRFVSLLRANATFPYIFPQVSLPSEPRLRIMDAGLRDNYGFKTTFRFIYSLQDWIEENTSGVVILQVRDKGKRILEKESPHDLIDRITSPLGNVYGNFTKTQDYSHDQMMQLMSEIMEVPIEEVRLQLEHEHDNKVSMSWHLTSLEKLRIEKAIDRIDNRNSIERLVTLLD